jgi:hypothetical protein
LVQAGNQVVPLPDHADAAAQPAQDRAPYASQVGAQQLDAPGVRLDQTQAAAQ